MNSSGRRCLGRGSTGIELIPYSARERGRGELKRIATWLIAVSPPMDRPTRDRVNGDLATSRSRIEERVRNATFWPSIEYTKALTAVVKRLTLVVWKVLRLSRGFCRIAQLLPV